KDAPAVLFFDEIDALARPRDDAHEATHRLVSTFLENMDGLQKADGVVVLAATNRPESVDAALTRPGRFDRLVEVPLPDRDGRHRGSGELEVDSAAQDGRFHQPACAVDDDLNLRALARPKLGTVLDQALDVNPGALGGRRGDPDHARQARQPDVAGGFGVTCQ